MAIIFVLFIALVLRVISLNQSFWWDEAINALYARSNDFWWFITKYPIGDFHPPGYFAILWIWGNFLGFSEVVVRIPSVIFGVLTIFLTYLIGKELFSKKIGILSALFLTFAPLHIYYSQEARMYSFAAFAAAISFYFFIKLVKNGSILNTIGYFVSLVLVLYSDYVTYLILPAQLLFLIVFKKQFWKKFLLALVISLFFYVPWIISIFPLQISSGLSLANSVPGWEEAVGGTSVKNLALVWVKTLVGRVSFENKIIYGGIVGILSGIWGIGVIRVIREMRGNKESAEGVKILFFWIFIPLILAWGVSFFIPILSYFRLLFILPAFYLLITYGLSQFKNNIFKILLSLILISEIIFTSVYLFNPKFHREDWKNAVKLTDDLAYDQTVILFESEELPAPFMYYSKNLANSSVFPGLKKVPAGSLEDLNNLKDILKGKPRVLLFEYLVEVNDPENLLRKELDSLNYKIKKINDFRGVGFLISFERI